MVLVGGERERLESLSSRFFGFSFFDPPFYSSNLYSLSSINYHRQLLIHSFSLPPVISTASCY